MYEEIHGDKPMKKLLWTILGVVLFFHHAVANDFQSNPELDGLQQKIAHYVATNQSLIGLALTDNELSALESNPEKYLPPAPALSAQMDILSRQLELMAARGQIDAQDMNRAIADAESIIMEYSNGERTANTEAVKTGDTKTNTYCSGIFCTTTVSVWIGGKWRVISVVTYLSIWPYTVVKQM
jgi:hypothetical protein